MIQVSIQLDLERAQTGLTNFQKVQVPFATSLALNRVAQFAQSAIKSNMNVLFDRPTPYTLNSVFVKNSTKSNLRAIVGFKNTGNGLPAAAYMQWEIMGGSRAKKSTEKIAGEIFVPTKAAKLNQYGNLAPVVVAAMRAALSSGNGQYVSGSTRYVVVRAGNARGLTPGIYTSPAGPVKTKITGRKGDKVATTSTGKLTPIAFFEQQARYKPRLDLEGIVRRVVATEFARQFEAQLAYALSTAR